MESDMKRWLTCGAKNRRGLPCQCKELYENGRCRFHGGLSTGPRTPEGKARALAAMRAGHAAWAERRRAASGKPPRPAAARSANRRPAFGAYTDLPFAKRLPTGTAAVLVFVRGKGSIRVLTLDRNDWQAVSSCFDGVVRARRDAWLAPSAKR
jgi:hypothetical protein